MNETKTIPMDAANLMIQRYLEHDADRMALVNLIENIRQEKGMYYQLLGFVGHEHGYRLLFFSVFSTLTILMISQIISGCAAGNSHPNILERMFYLITFIELTYEGDEKVISGLKNAVQDWNQTYELFGWKAFINARVQIVKPSRAEEDQYFQGVSKILTELDKVLENILPNN